MMERLTARDDLDQQKEFVAVQEYWRYQSSMESVQQRLREQCWNRSGRSC